MKPDLLAVGKIAKPFGVGGEVVVQSFADSPARFGTLKYVYLGASAETAGKTSVCCTSIEPRGVRLLLGGLTDRSAAEEVVGHLLFVDETQRPKLPKGRFYVHDIIGLAVEDEAGNPVGNIEEVLKYPAHDVYVIRHGRGEILLPAVKEFVLSINPARGTMRVRLIAGMVDE
jgi:16S rRNA processing protein RimM